MDSPNPFGSDSQNFMDLLNSQKNSNASANSAQTSHPIQFSSPFSTQPTQFNPPFSTQSIQFSPPFSSQSIHTSQVFSSQPVNSSTQLDSLDCIEVTQDDHEEDEGRGSRKRWSAQEDIHLISAWLNTSKDHVVSNEQQKGSFWKDHVVSNDDILEGRARVTYVVNERQYKMAHYLTDGIYPKWATFIQSITLPRG
ncbi:PREDICTED: uncharacterized protein LOC104793816 [Camelina sativa]|uniref:Uncharacterized protein LOC104793816 n=1 Tax=Camelina sativa TaxID=90675 RepID=A0ABM0ZP82_CAMSA|nr:PREDICTED: uncharacterized protein LOC104793816 [Camelina sativa]